MGVHHSKSREKTNVGTGVVAKLVRVMKQKDIDKLNKYFEYMRLPIVRDCSQKRHISAICGSIGRVGTKESRDIFKRWLSDNNIEYTGEL